MSKTELKHEYSKLYWNHGGLICHAAIGLITRVEASQLLDIYPREVAERVNKCNVCLINIQKLVYAASRNSRE